MLQATAELEAGRLGEFLKALRQERGWTLTGLAQRAQLAKGTLSYWETGAHQPRLPELEVVLQVLEVTPDQHREALSLIPAARTIRRLREADRETTPSWLETAGMAPSGSHLLRALRLRRGWPLQQVAAAIGIHHGTLSRWERGESWPAPERLRALCAALGATDAELQALAQRHYGLFAAPEAECGGEALEVKLEILRGQVQDGHYALLDLEFLSLEANLWKQARKRPSARLLLAEGYACHARWLACQGRLAEAGPLAEQALDLMERRYCAQPHFMWAVFVSADYATGIGHRNRYGQGIEFLRAWLPYLKHPEERAWIYRDMADFASGGRQHASALDFARCAEEAAESSGDAECQHLCRHIHAGVLLRAGQPRKALALLPAATSPFYIHAACQEMRWTEALLEAGDHTDADAWLRRAYATIDTYEITKMRPYADILARSL